MMCNFTNNDQIFNKKFYNNQGYQEWRKSNTPAGTGWNILDSTQAIIWVDDRETTMYQYVDFIYQRQDQSCHGPDKKKCPRQDSNPFDKTPSVIVYTPLRRWREISRKLATVTYQYKLELLTRGLLERENSYISKTQLLLERDMVEDNSCMWK